MGTMPLALAAGLAALAVTAPGAAAQAKPDRKPPSVQVSGDLQARCDGEPVELRFRVSGPGATRTVVRLDGRQVERTRSKRFTVTLRLGKGAYTVKTVARDRSGNRFTHTLNVVPC